jgi:hypothetical protein
MKGLGQGKSTQLLLELFCAIAGGNEVAILHNIISGVILIHGFSRRFPAWEFFFPLERTGWQ